jgi:hypothetical protein
LRVRGLRDGLSAQDIQGEIFLPPVFLSAGTAFGKLKGIEQGQKADILEALEIRFGDVPGEVRERVNGFGDASRLRQLHRAVIQAATLEEFLQSL